jgi:hypothetical protein
VKFQKNIPIQILAGMALFHIFTSTAPANPLNQSGKANNWYTADGFQSGFGGEFYFQTVSGPVSNTAYHSLAKNQAGVSDSFQSFCLEWNEWLGGAGVSYTVNDQAMLGGVSNQHGAGSQGGDPLSLGTTWLYSQFAQGVLANYFTAADRTTMAGFLQNAIWAMEDEISDPAAGSNPFFDAAAVEFGGYAAAQADAASGQYGVWVLNNTKVHNDSVVKKQDMIYYAGVIPSLAGFAVSDGGSTAILLGLGLSGLVLGHASRKPRQPALPSKDATA